MKRKLWIGLGISAVLILIASYFYIRSVYFFPRSDVSVTNQIGWWAYQDHLIIKSLDCEVREVRFGLFKTGEALVQFRIKGEMATENPDWKPVIEQVHVSERFAMDKEQKEGDFQITPVVGIKKDAGYNGEQIPFEIKIEYIIRAYQWGENKYIFHCGSITRELSLEALK